MGTVRVVTRFWTAFGRSLSDRWRPRAALLNATAPPRIGLALGGGFARGIAHAGVLDVFAQHQIPIHCITGVSAGAIVAAAFASGVPPPEIMRAGCAMRFGDVARWSLCRMGFAASERMKRFLERLLNSYRFEEMHIPLGVIATNLATGEAVKFRDAGDVFLPIRASCSYPGLFRPLRHDGHLLVDGAMSVEVPTLLARELGATHVIAVHLPSLPPGTLPNNVFQVVNRCFEILNSHNEQTWRQHTDLVITPDVRGVGWDGFDWGPELVKAGQTAALSALPKIREWLGPIVDAAGSPAITPGSITA